MALAEKLLAEEFNQPFHRVVDHHTYVFLGDGCLMEGVSHEACSLAGTLKLGKLTCFYDDNGISIDGEVHGWFTDDTPQRFEAYGWHVVRDVDGHDAAAIERAIQAALTEPDRPSLICCKTIIGWGAPNKQGTEATHGAALGEAEVAATRNNIDWPYEPFVVPEEIKAGWDATASGARAERAWRERMASYAGAYPELAAEFERRVKGELPAGWRAALEDFLRAAQEKPAALATRSASQKVLDVLGAAIPEMLGGSADLTGSNNTNHKASRAVTGSDLGGNYVHYGVREFGMTAIANGIALHGGLIPYTATFLVFSDYARNAIRMAALMKQRQIMVYTHDSIGLGEDGPTHQPVEHIPSLRIIPNLDVWRPADATETAIAWISAVDRSDGPSVLALSRQNLPTVTQNVTDADIARGGYILSDCAGEPRITFIATGSEVKLALDAQGALAAEGIATRVVSMPCSNVFDRQDAEYRKRVVGACKTRIAIEAAHPDFWRKYVGLHGTVIGIDRFGESAPAGQLFDLFGFTVGNVVATAKALLS
jgi:transketolase